MKFNLPVRTRTESINFVMEEEGERNPGNGGGKGGGYSGSNNGTAGMAGRG